MLENLLSSLSFHILCTMAAFGLYITNCYVLRIRRARLPFKVMLTALLPYLNVVLILMQLCFFSYTFVNLLSKAINGCKTSKVVTRLGYPVKANSNNKVPRRV